MHEDDARLLPDFYIICTAPTPTGRAGEGARGLEFEESLLKKTLIKDCGQGTERLRQKAKKLVGGLPLSRNGLSVINAG